MKLLGRVTLLITCLTFGASTQADPKVASLVGPHSRAAELSNNLIPKTILVTLPADQKLAVFSGPQMSEVLDLLFTKNWRSGENDLVVFTALDQYSVAIPVEKFLARISILATERIRPFPGGKFTINVTSENKKNVEVGPFYLVWDYMAWDPFSGADAFYGNDSNWPYKIASISLQNSKEYFAQALPPPSASAAAQRGFKVFALNCIGCHKVNEMGGAIGPKLDLQPISSLEGYLKNYVTNPKKQNKDALMPLVAPNVKGKARTEMIDDVFEYLKTMEKDHL